MATKTKKAVKVKVRYVTEKSYRWGLCMKLAKLAYRSTLSEHQLEENIELICENFQPIKIK